MNLDFGFKGDANSGNADTSNGNNNADPITDLSTGQVIDKVSGEPVDDINSISHDDDNTNKGKQPVNTTGTGFDNGDGVTNTTTKEGDNSQDDKNENGDDTSKELIAGSVIELGEDKYTVNATGDLVDKDGNIFKESKDVKTWLDTFDSIKDGDDTSISIDTIQETIGIQLTDENDQPIKYDNTPEGVKAYLEAVTEANRDTHYQEAIDTLYEKYPIISDVLNYYIANGNSLEGFGEVQDRSNITIDEANEAQQESIIRTAWKEQNKKGDVEGYIAYLKSSGTLTAIATEELAGLQEADNQYKEDLALKAKEAEDAKIQKAQEYWKGVQEVIQNKNIAGYQIPDTIIINKDGKKLSATPNDFYNYVYQTDKEGLSAYQRELAKEDPTSRRDDELLKAYLKFVGGNYSNLVGMAVNKEKVATLKLQAKGKAASSIKITKPTTVAKGANTDFGYK